MKSTIGAAPDLATGRFDPPRGLENPHLQSLLSSWPLRGTWLRAGARALLGAARETVLDCGGGVRLQGFVSRQAGARGLAILLHGWEGCADANYVISLGARLYAHGYDVFRLNFRDHGGTQALNTGLFHSCRIDEVVGAVAAIERACPAERTVLVGHSLGGNFALRVAARAEAAGLGLAQVFAVCPVLDPRATMAALERGLWIYRYYFLRRWRRSLEIKARCFPERYDFGDLRRFPTLTETTRFFVERYTEFPDLESYLDGYAITGPVLEGLSVPSRLIAAADDPVIPSRDLVRLARPRSLTLSVLRHGGHCGFLDNWRLASWIDGEILASV